jgi:hypothetical protein
LFLFDSGAFDGFVYGPSSLILFDASRDAESGTRPTKHPYFKDLPGFYISGRKKFVSGKQKSAIFRNKYRFTAEMPRRSATKPQPNV